MRVRKVVKKPGVNAAISMNINEGSSRVTASSKQDAQEPEVKKEEAKELPDREGTYDELREAADKKANEGENDDR
jgi:hypothetical protein